MVKQCYRVKKLKRSTYSEIRDKMLAVEWEYDISFPNSLFDRSDSNYFHAGIYYFENVGYLLTPYGFIMANLLQKKIRKSINGYSTSKPYIQ